jgi:succinate dehydrogenase / fumarate reductase flavoprotein subunit
VDVPETSVKTDVLVVGAGIAGCFAAMRARELGAEVVMVEQGKSGFWGMSTGGTHRLRVVLPEDDFEAALEGTVRECEYMIDQDFARSGLQETPERLEELMGMGISFRRSEDGGIQWYWADTADANFRQRNVLWEPIGTHKHLLKVHREALRRGVRVLDRLLVTHLLDGDGEVKGAVGLGTRTGEFFRMEAKAVVVASGGFSGGGIGNWPSLTGDGIALGLRVGAELRGMEFGKAEAGGILMDRGCPAWVFVLLNPQEEGNTFTNALGEEFLEQYELGRRVPGRKYYGPPFRVQLMATLKELREGSGPCYIDYSAPGKASRLREFWGSFHDRTVKQMELSGTTLNQAKYELGIARGFNQSGGLRITPDGETSVRGLYSAGQSSDMCGTAQYTILSGMMSSMITGKRAGESAAKFARPRPALAGQERQVRDLKREVYSPLLLQRGTTADEMRMKVTNAWLNVDIRTESRLKQAHEDFGSLREEMSSLTASDPHELVKCHKIRNYLDCSDAVAVAARSRRETRLEHLREDFPLTDNKDWLKWVIVRRGAGGIEATLEDLPLAKWKYRPEPVLVDRLRKAQTRDLELTP